MNKKIWVFFFSWLLFFGVVRSTQALPINGGFEAGDLSGWNYTGDVSVATSFSYGGATYNPTEGSYLAKLGASADSELWFDPDPLLIIDTFDVIMPSLSTFSFWTRVFVPNQPYQEYESQVYNTASSVETIDLGKITFSIPADWHALVYRVSVAQGETVFVDNVSGHVIPEPSSLLLLGTGLLGLAGIARRREIFTSKM